MIRIFLSNQQQLELPENLALTINMHNPIFDNDSRDRVFSYSFRVELSPKNRILFGHANRLDNSTYFQDDDALLEIDGFPFERGVLTVSDFRNNTAQVSFKDAATVKLEDLKSIKINQFCDTVIVKYYTSYRIGLHPTNSYYQLVLNNVFYTSYLQDSLAAANELASAINTDHPGTTLVSSIPGAHQLEISHVSESVQLMVNENAMIGTYVIHKEFGSTSATQAEVLTHVKDIIENAIDSHAFPTVKWYDFYEDKNVLFENVVNEYYDGSMTTSTTGAEEDGWPATLVPFVRLKHALTKCLEQIGIDTIFGTFPELPDFNQLLIFNNYALDRINTVLDENIYKSKYDLNDHVPDISAFLLLNIILRGFAQYVVLNGSTLEFKFKKDQLISAPIDWTGKSTQDYGKTPIDPSGFKLQLTPDEADIVPDDITYQLDPFIHGSGEKDVIIEFGSLYDYIIEPDPGAIRQYSYRTCRVKSKGSSDEKGIGKTRYPLKLFFERGLKTDTNGRTYPMSSNGNIDAHDNLIGNFTLTPNGQYGLYEYCFKGFIEYINNPSIKKTVHLDIGDIFTLRKWENSKRKMKTKEGEFVGIIKTLSFKAHVNKTISPANVELIRYATN